MKTLRTFFVTTVLVPCLFVGIVFGQGQSTNISMAFRPLPPNTTAEWKAEAERLGELRIQLVSDVLQRLIHERDAERKALLIFLLGEYRATEAASVLVGMISFEAPRSSKNGGLKTRPLWGTHPAAEALVKIGVPACRAVMQRLETETNTAAMKLEVDVICAVYRSKDVAELVLVKAAANEADAKKKANLQASLQILRDEKRRR